MGWVQVSDTVEYYSVASEIGEAVLNIIKFLLNVQPSVYVIGILMLVGIMILYIMVGIRNTVKRPLQ